jgi:hypothetical protein
MILQQTIGPTDGATLNYSRAANSFGKWLSSRSGRREKFNPQVFRWERGRLARNLLIRISAVNRRILSLGATNVSEWSGGNWVMRAKRLHSQNVDLSCPATICQSGSEP